MVAIPRPQAPLVDRAGYPAREWYTYFLELRSAAGSNADLQAAIDKIIERLAQLEQSSPLNFRLLGLDSIIVTGTPQNGYVQINLEGDATELGPTWYYGTGPDGARGWYLLADALAVTDDLTKEVDAETGVTTFGLADVPDSGEGAALVKITRDQFGRVAGTESANTNDLPEGANNLYFTPDRVYEATKEQLVAGDNITIEPDDATKTITISASGGFVPYYIPDNTTFVVPLYQQALFTLPIDLGDGASIELDGALVEVD